MKLLFDHPPPRNLSHRLVDRLADDFPDSAHVRAASLDRASDDQIWEYARTNHFCIVTQDSDFADRSRLFGSPPKVVWLRCGNATPRQVEAVLRRHVDLITELIQNPALDYLEIV